MGSHLNTKRNVLYAYCACDSLPPLYVNYYAKNHIREGGEKIGGGELGGGPKTKWKASGTRPYFSWSAAERRKKKNKNKHRPCAFHSYTRGTF